MEESKIGSGALDVAHTAHEMDMASAMENYVDGDEFADDLHVKVEPIEDGSEESSLKRGSLINLQLQRKAFTALNWNPLSLMEILNKNISMKLVVMIL